MKTLKLSTLVFALVFGAWLGCGSSKPGSGTGGSLVMGGSLGTGGALDGGGGMGGITYDAPSAGGSEGSPEAGQGGSSTCGATGYVDCTGLTPAQCHDLITNPPTIQDCIAALNPGANPPILYPNCSAQ